MSDLNNALHLELLRSTRTGDLHTRVFLVLDDYKGLDLGTYDAVGIPQGSRLLVLSPGPARMDLLERLLDWCELGFHAGYSARTGGNAVHTEFDIRSYEARKNVGEEPLPF